MKKLLSVALPALLGAVIGSVIRQKVKGTERELTIAAHPAPVVAGAVAGLLSPKAKTIVALTVSLNVASNYPR
jgi:Na+/glutamate symporter